MRWLALCMLPLVGCTQIERRVTSKARAVFETGMAKGCMTADAKGMPRDGFEATCRCISAELVRGRSFSELSELDRLESDDPALEAAAAACEFEATGEEWSCPAPPVRRPVHVDAYRPKPPPQNPRAQALLRQADELKGSGQYAKGQAVYEAALRADPTLSRAAYQLACNHALAGQAEPALSALARAVELGYSSYGGARFDYDLHLVKSSPRYQALLAKIRANYLAKTPPAGQPIYVTPRAPRPSSGYPAIVLLHGYGDRPQSYITDADAWAELGFVAIALPGSIPRADGAGFTWSQQTVELTHEAIRAAVSDEALRDLVDPDETYLLGFSQGALHAFQVAVAHSKTYRGLVAVGPGGRPWTLGDSEVLRTDGKPRLVMVYGEDDAARDTAVFLDRLAASAGWPHVIIEHPGGHHFPEDWEAQRPGVAEFLRKR